MKYLLFSFFMLLIQDSFAQFADKKNFALLQYDSVVAYNININDEYVDQNFINNNKINPKIKISFTKQLKTMEIRQAINIFTAPTTYGNGYASCFIPRFAIIFFKKNKIVANIQICLECNRLYSSLDIYAKKKHQYLITYKGNEIYETPYYDAPKYMRESKNASIRPSDGLTKKARKRIHSFCKRIGMKYNTRLTSVWD